MDLPISPYTSIGPIHFGMSREEVRFLLGSEYEETLNIVFNVRGDRYYNHEILELKSSTTQMESVKQFQSIIFCHMVPPTTLLM